MGILNVTPDSFSDGGNFLDIKVAVDAAISMFLDGADIVDIGGESSRPGALSVSPEEQLERVLPVIEALKSDRRLPSKGLISIDTCSALVAEKAITHGAGMVNDITAGTGDPNMFTLVAQSGIPVVIFDLEIPCE